jgi:penicillin-binding protein 2
MYSVVNEPKGSVYNLYKGFGVTVAGKTGNSQISTNVPNNALFLSYAPYENPKISVTAVIYNGFTSWNAADLARDIYKLYFKLQDEKDLVDKEATRPTSNIDGLLE